MAWDTGLNGTHLNIAAYAGSPLRVIAGPGTGKTFALMRRVARLLESGVAPETVLAVTFTRTAAKDLVDKLSQLDVPGRNAVVARTLHSLSFSILGTSAVFQVTGRVPRPLLQHEEEMLVCDLKDGFGGKRKTQALLRAFEAYWARLQHEQPGWPTDPKEREFDTRLRAWLSFHQAMLIGELVPLALDFVRDNPHSEAVPSFDHILVDEFQDLNRADQALVDALAKNGSRVTVIGDEDQSIFSFRYAHPEGISEYQRDHANTHDEILEDCRRCPSLVVDMATSLIQRNTRARATIIRPLATNPPGDVAIVQHRSSKEEADILAAFVDQYLQNHPQVDPGEVLILATRRAFGYRLRDALNSLATENTRPWRSQSYFLEQSLDSPRATEGFALLTLLVDSDDRAALRAWLGLGDADGRAKPYWRVRQHCENAGLTPRQALDRLIAGDLQLPYTRPVGDRYRELLQQLEGARQLDGVRLVEELFPSADDGCNEIRTIALRVLETAGDTQALLNEMRALVTQPELPDDHSKTVRVMSLQKSKGLTARVVIIAGLVAGAIPSFDPRIPTNQQRAREEEQRRLFYVALTRTTETLVLSSAARMSTSEAYQMNLPVVMKGRNTVAMQASAFLSELGQNRPATETGRAWRVRVGF